MDFVAIDVETANARLGSICQVGVAGFEGGELVGEWKTLVDPEDFFDPVNVRIHGVTESDVQGAPTLPQIIGELDEWLAGRVVVCHTHFDRVALAQACEAYELAAPECTWLDSARVARRTWDQFSRSGYGLENVCAFLGHSYQAHDALEDAKASGVVLLRASEAMSLSVEEWLGRVVRPIHPGTHQHVQIAREGNPDGPLYGEVVVFTGALQMPRREAADLADAVGCRVDPGVTRQTSILIVGDQDVARLAGHDKSSKHRKVEQLISAGQPVRILRESDFLNLVQLDSDERVGAWSVASDAVAERIASCQFGYNCSHYLPSLGKCRVLVDLRRKRPDLTAEKWLNARDALVYTGCSPDELVRQVEHGSVAIQRLKNGKLMFGVRASWDWDDCPLGDAGGQCLHFQAHGGTKISCLRELELLLVEHPNAVEIPTDIEVGWTEARFSHVQYESKSRSQ